MHRVPPLDSAHLGLHVHIIIIKIEVMHMSHLVLKDYHHTAGERVAAEPIDARTNKWWRKLL